VFLDIKLPKLDGMEVLRQIKGDPKTRAIPVIMLTSSGEDRDIRESYELGANSYVVKPVNFEDYQSKVAAVARYWTSFNRARHGWAFVS
jgi:CheY-like chemotaxis protein